MEKRKHDNRVQGYLKPKQISLLKGFTDSNSLSQSAALNMIVKDFFSRLPEDQRIDFLSRARTKIT